MKLIVATNNNEAIGKDGKMPWSVNKEDLRHFYRTTVNNIVIMGRKTFDSLGGNPLKKRYNIVITSKDRSSENTKELFFANNLDQAIIAAEELQKQYSIDCYIIGGGSIYEEFLSRRLVDEVILTQIWENQEGDTYFSLPKGFREYKKKDLKDGSTVYFYRKKKVNV